MVALTPPSIDIFVYGFDGCRPAVRSVFQTVVWSSACALFAARLGMAVLLGRRRMPGEESAQNLLAHTLREWDAKGNCAGDYPEAVLRRLCIERAVPLEMGAEQQVRPGTFSIHNH